MATGGLSSGQYKPEHEYFSRYFRLVNETGAKPLKKLLELEATNRNMTVDAFLGTKKRTFLALIQRKIIKQDQYELMYPTQNRSFDIDNLDITLLCCIIKNVCTLSSKGRNATDDLREERNKLCHASKPEMEETIYNAKFSKVCNVIKLLLIECGDKNFETEIEHETHTVNDDPLSVAQTMKYIKLFTDQQQVVNFEMVTDKIEQLEDRISHKTDDLTTGIKQLSVTVEKQPKITIDALEKLLKTHKGEEDTIPKIYSSIEPLRNQTEVILNEVSDFVDTQQFYEVEQMLLSSGVVIITGGAGEGKTYTAFEIMRRHGVKRNCLQINCPNDVSLIDPRIFEFVFIDDIFGNNELDESKLKSWFPVLEKLQQLVNTRQLKLIIATREIVLKEGMQFLRKFAMFTKRTILSSGKLSSAEKLEILSKALHKRQRYCSQETMQNCVSAFKSDLGFPFMCILFSSDEQFFYEGHSFFKRNFIMNSGIVSQLTPCKQMSLLFLWLKGNRFPVILNRSEENDNILLQLIDIVEYGRDTDIDGLYHAIHTSLKVMDGVFVNERADGYWFAHNSIYQSCGLYLARKGLYTEIIRYSTLAFFKEQITISESVYRADCVFVRKNMYQNIVDRIISEVMEHGHAREMAVLQCLSKDVLKLLIETLDKRKQLKEFLLCDTSKRNDLKCNSFITYYLETCAPYSCWFLGQILSSLKSKRHYFSSVTKEGGSRTYQILQNACRGACRGGNLDAFKLIQTIKFDDSVLVDIAASGNTEMYKYVMNILRTNNVNFAQDRALVECAKKGDIKMYNTIRQSGYPTSTRCIRAAAEWKNVEIMKHIIKDLGQSQALKNDVHVNYTLSTLFSFEVFETFLKNGICPSKDNLRLILNDNYKLVETILLDTKYFVQLQTKQRKFDLRLELWSDLISDTFWRNQLYKMGIINSPNYLDNVNAKRKRMQIAQKVLRLEKQPDWNPASDFAIDLLNSALRSDPIMYELLLFSDIKLNECTLYRAVMTGNLELVEMTVARMKEDENFKPKFEYVQRAFLHSIFFFNIYEYFVNQGLQPTAYHYRFAVECQKEQAETLKVLKHIYSLTDNFSSLNKNVMGATLLLALESDNIARFFIEHNVKLPEDALFLISYERNLNKFKKAIEYLKCQSDWSSCQSVFSNSLYHTFYKPELFELLMAEIGFEEICMPVYVYSILFAIRRNKYDLVENYISLLQENDLWNSNDIVLKVALLESIDNIETKTLLKRNGVRTDGLLSDAYKLANTDLVSYIIAFREKNDHQEIKV